MYGKVGGLAKKNLTPNSLSYIFNYQLSIIH